MSDFQPTRRDCLTAAALMASIPLSAPLAQARRLRIAAFGDSLSAGYGLPQRAAFYSVLQRELKAKGLDVVVDNAAVSGDTASAGQARLDWSVQDGTDLVIVELGANDALRGIDPAVTERALDDILTRLKARGMAVVLAGMYAPPNYGGEYARRFNGIYPKLAEKHGVPLYPFFLEGVVGVQRLNLPDGIHPTAEGVEEIVRRILPTVEAAARKLIR